MGIFEIISAIVLIIACVFIVIVVLMQDTKTQMSQTISGNTGDNYFGKNSGRTKEAQLNKAMITAAIISSFLRWLLILQMLTSAVPSLTTHQAPLLLPLFPRFPPPREPLRIPALLNQARQEARLSPPEQLRRANRMLKAQLPLLNSKKTGQALPPVLFVNNR